MKEQTPNSKLQTPNSRLRAAVVCDWLIGGGAEKVVLELHRMFPQAPIYTSYCTEEWKKRLDGKVVTGYLQNWPFSKLRKFIPFLRGWWFSRLNLSHYDLVISSSGAEAKFIRVVRRNGQMKNEKINGKWKMKNGKPNMMRPLHVAYIHAPTHYYWDRYEDYLKSPGFGGFDWLARFGLKLLVGPMRKWDYRAAQRPDKLIANSNFTKNQIKKYYGRDSAVIHPPVDVERFKLQTINHELRTARKGFVTAGRQTPYKRIDLAVAACTKLGLPLAVIGDGPDHKKLVRMAGPTVKFVSAEDSQMADYFQKAQAFIFPGLDDFGVVAVEAMAAGTPVIACNGGGALDYIEQDKNGNFFENQSVQNLSAVLSTFDSKKFDNLFISQQAQRFGINVFRKKMSGFLDSLKTIP